HVFSPPLRWGESIYHIATLASCPRPQLTQRALQPEGELAAPIRASAYDSRQELQLRFVRLFGTYLPAHVELTVRQGGFPGHRPARLDEQILPLAGECHRASLLCRRFEFTLQGVAGNLTWEL